MPIWEGLHLWAEDPVLKFRDLDFMDMGMCFGFVSLDNFWVSLLLNSNVIVMAAFYILHKRQGKQSNAWISVKALHTLLLSLIFIPMAAAFIFSSEIPFHKKRNHARIHLFMCLQAWVCPWPSTLLTSCHLPRVSLQWDQANACALSPGKTKPTTHEHTRSVPLSSSAKTMVVMRLHAPFWATDRAKFSVYTLGEEWQGFNTITSGLRGGGATSHTTLQLMARERSSTYFWTTPFDPIQPLF